MGYFRLDDDVLDSDAYRVLTDRQRTMLVEFLRRHYRATNYDHADELAPPVPFTFSSYPWKVGDKANKQFNPARAELMRVGFIEEVSKEQGLYRRSLAYRGYEPTADEREDFLKDSRTKAASYRKTVDHRTATKGKKTDSSSRGSKTPPGSSKRGGSKTPPGPGGQKHPQGQGVKNTPFVNNQNNKTISAPPRSTPPSPRAKCERPNDQRSNSSTAGAADGRYIHRSENPPIRAERKRKNDARGDGGVERGGDIAQKVVFDVVHGPPIGSLPTRVDDYVASIIRLTHDTHSEKAFRKEVSALLKLPGGEERVVSIIDYVRDDNRQNGKHKIENRGSYVYGALKREREQLERELTT